MLAKKSILSKTISDAYVKTLSYVLKTGEITYIASNIKAKEVLNLSTAIENPLLETNIPKELIPYVEKQAKERLPILIKALVDDSIYPRTSFSSGERLLKWRSERKVINQIANIIEALKKDNLTQRAMVTSLNPLFDSMSRLDDGYDFPIFGAIDFKYRRKLHLTAHLRHCNVFSWWFVNALQLSRLMEFIASQTSLETGSITMFIGSAYVREEDLKFAESLVQTIKE